MYHTIRLSWLLLGDETPDGNRIYYGVIDILAEWYMLNYGRRNSVPRFFVAVCTIFWKSIGNTIDGKA